MLPLLLASSSPYRRELLARLRLPFTWESPDIDEQRLNEEPAVELVRRLARQKAEALAGSHPGHLIIGSDQVAVLGEQILGKPLSFERACEQLLEASGQQVTLSAPTASAMQIARLTASPSIATQTRSAAPMTSRYQANPLKVWLCTK